ncbi:MAG: PQQ-binding-like beta-propeller repeat protein [Bacteroidetes bacterium]|nr:PQQ-binding-like beta-propeller repeat protein [Bacteroidota bacterium]
MKRHKISPAIILLLTALTLFGCKEKEITPLDWPQFKMDNFRSAHSSIQLDLSNLSKDWQFTAPQPPSPAWYGPAKEDAYANSGPLPSMRDYDLAFYPIVVGQKLFYGSSADNGLHCLNTKNGKKRWTFTTGGPIRIAPAYHYGKLYFGSDDGYVYCVNASNGKLVWKYSPSPEDAQKVINNYALISFWPVRTGILIEEGIAYFGASLLPWKESYFCAINIETGLPDKEGTYIKKYENMTLEGSMASTGTIIVQPQGRISPMFFNRNDGECKGPLAGTGGCFVLITPEKNIVHPQTSRFKSIAETFGEKAIPPLSPEEKKKADFMSFKGGKEMVVKDSCSFILTDNSISAYNRKTKKIEWLKRNYQAHRLIISGDVLYVGAVDTVYAVSANNGLPLWKAAVKGVVNALVVADNALFTSTGEGHIYCFRSGKTENPLLAINKDKPAIIEEEEKTEKPEENNTLELAAGPYVNTIDKHSVEVHFFTEQAVKCQLDWGQEPNQQNISEELETHEHHIIVKNLRENFIYPYQIRIGDQSTKRFEFDNLFNFEEELTSKKIPASLQKLVVFNQINPANKGFCVVFRPENISLPLEIAQYSGMKVFMFETSLPKVEKLRKKWQKTGIYGKKISIHPVADLSKLPITGDIADIVISSETSTEIVEEAIRIIKPGGYATIINQKKQSEKWAEAAKNAWQIEYVEKEGIQLLQKKPYEFTGVWTHQYASADNSAFGGESLWGSTSTEDFEVQWMGRPGPRFQTDRSGRKPSPLAVNGKLFVQGNERILALDAYNGKVLWSKEIPDMVRMNIHRDCSNWAADENFVYIALKNTLLKLNNTNGTIDKLFYLVQPTDSISKHWGFISVLQDRIIGSVTPKNSQYKNFHGGQGWYDAKEGPLSDKIVSSVLFAKSKDGDDTFWEYKHAAKVIINATITISKNQISFVESRNPNFKLTEEGRADPSLFKNLYLVSLDVQTGQKNWEKAIAPIAGVTTFFMAAGEGNLIILSANDGKYHLYLHDASTGKILWKKTQNWFATHHGGHFSRPAIVNNRLIVKPAVYDLQTGERLQSDVPKAGHGCASYALSEQSIFYRGGSVTQYNFDSEEFTQWNRLRPDCWISTIPAQGLVLSPEAGGGCSCGNWLETSMVFTPTSRAPISFLHKKGAFLDTLTVEIKAKNPKDKVFYTLDGSEPNQESSLYTEPIILTDNTELNALLYIEKDGVPVPFLRRKFFRKM